MSFLLSLVIYLATYSLSVACVYAAEKHTGLKRLMYPCAVIVPSITAAFRESGIDYVTYKSIYRWIHGTGADYLEPLWILINKISFTYEFCLFLAALILCGAACTAICRFLKKDRWLAWFIFLVVCYNAFLNNMRQMLAVSIVFLGFSYLKDKKLLQYFICVMIASLFHKATVVMLLVPIGLVVIKRIKNPEILMLPLCIAAPVVLPIIKSISLSLGLFTSYFSKPVNSSYGFLLYMLPPLFFYYLLHRECVNDSLTKWFHNMYLLVFPFQFWGGSIAYVDRFMLYFQIFITVLVPSIIHRYDEKYKQHGVRILYFLWFVIHFTIIYVVMNGNGIFPYRL